MGCGCGKPRRPRAEQMKLDHAAMELLRRIPGASWVFDGEALRVVTPRNPAPRLEEEYGDPADAVRYWAYPPSDGGGSP